MATSSTTRRLPTLLSLGSRVRSSKCFFGQSIRTTAQFVAREAEADTRIFGAPKKQRLHLPLQSDWPRCIPPGYDRSVSSVLENKCSKPLGHRLIENLQKLTAKFSPKPKPKSKPDFLVRHIDEDDCEYLTAYSVEEDGTFSRQYDIYPPAAVQERSFFICSGRSGLVYFQNEENEHLLWNPTTNEFKILPNPFDQLPRVTYCDVAVQTWFENATQDYKVLLLVLVDEEDEKGECIDLSYQIGLYSLTTDSWKKIPCPEFGFCENYGVCINGFYYSPLDLDSGLVILSFDFSTATVSTLPLPNISKSEYFYVVEYKGLLSVLVYSGKKLVRDYVLWVMNDGSWTKETVFHTCGVRKLELFSENGELVYFQNLNDEIVVFDRATGKLKPLGVYCIEGTLDLYTFFENFVQLKGVPHVEQEQDKEEEEEEEGEQTVQV